MNYCIGERNLGIVECFLILSGMSSLPIIEAASQIDQVSTIGNTFGYLEH